MATVGVKGLTAVNLYSMTPLLLD